MIRKYGFLMIGLALLIVLYSATLQTIPNGSTHEYLVDVGETQIVLNVWGTLHTTGYPHYVITGNLLTALFEAVGVDTVTAPALVSLLWGVVASVLIYLLALRFTTRAWVAAAVVVAFGLTRSMWLHHVVAEIYSFGLVLLLVLLLLAFSEVRGKIYWLAFFGGLALAHHRAFLMAIPALVYAVWPVLMANRRRLPQMIGVSLLLALIGFIPYAYLYLRAQAGADWVYGEPGTLAGLWEQLIGLEASAAISTGEARESIFENLTAISSFVVQDVTIFGVAFGLVGLGAGFLKYRRAAVTFILLAVAAYLFHVLFSFVFLAALILMVTLALAFGWLFLLEVASDFEQPAWALGTVMGVFLMMLFILNFDFIDGLTSDPTGLETIEQLQAAPEDATVILPWGPRYFAAAIAQELQDDLQQITLVDHQVDLAAIDGQLLTSQYSFSQQPVAWWEEQLGTEVYLQAVAPMLVELATTPDTVDDPPEDAVQVTEADLTCGEERLILDVTWVRGTAEAGNWSVFVHALNESGEIIAQSDQPAPVYGWYPISDWLPGERVRDIYPLDAENVAQVRYGLGDPSTDDTFNTILENTITCPS